MRWVRKASDDQLGGGGVIGKWLYYVVHDIQKGFEKTNGRTKHITTIYSDDILLP